MTMLICDECEEVYLSGEVAGGDCPRCGDLLRLAPEEERDEFLILRDRLPPFKCKHSPGGFEVFIGNESLEGGRFACRSREDEERFRKLLQEAVDTMGEDEEPDVEQLESKVHFLLSHAVHMGWWLLVPKSYMDQLSALDNERRIMVSRSAEKPDHIELRCANCGAEEVSLHRSVEVLEKTAANVKDGRIVLGPVQSSSVVEERCTQLECRACGYRCGAPSWVSGLIEGVDPDSPIPYKVANDQILAGRSGRQLPK